MIKIKKSATADSRTCDYSLVTKQQLMTSSEQHIDDVKRGLGFFREMLIASGIRHDFDKLTDIDGFYRDFITGFETTDWWKKHKAVNRHHLADSDGIPDDVNLIDVLDMIVDCVMAGMGRAGNVYPIDISTELLMRAFNNTFELLRNEVIVEDNP